MKTCGSKNLSSLQTCWIERKEGRLETETEIPDHLVQRSGRDIDQPAPERVTGSPEDLKEHEPEFLAFPEDWQEVDESRQATEAPDQQGQQSESEIDPQTEDRYLRTYGNKRKSPQLTGSLSWTLRHPPTVYHTTQKII